METVHLVAMAVTLAGISLVIRDRNLAQDRYGHHQGSVRDGIMLGIFAASCQSLGIALSKVVLESSFQALEVSAIRIGVAVLGGLLMAVVSGSLPGWKKQLMQKGIPGRIFVASLVGTYIGIWLSHVSAEHLPLAIATTQMSMTPIFMVLLVGIFLRQKISAIAFVGMILASLGVAILMDLIVWGF